MQERQQLDRNGSESYRLHLLTANRLASEAWTAFNSAFHTPESEEYRRTGQSFTSVSSKRSFARCTCGAMSRTLSSMPTSKIDTQPSLPPRRGRSRRGARPHGGGSFPGSKPSGIFASRGC